MSPSSAAGLSWDSGFRPQFLFYFKTKEMDNLDEEDILRVSQAATNVLDDCNIPNTLRDGQGDEFDLIFYHTRDQLSSGIRGQLMKMLETNIRTYYEQTWGWDDASKRKEVFANDAKYLMIRHPNDDKTVVAWVMFKFDWDDLDEPEHPVLFCYELHVDPSYRRRGLGREVI
jgi:ribosomal protein S18 acetylase RimI-like enzyme